MSRSAKSKGKVDREYLNFIRSQPCCVPNCISTRWSRQWSEFIKARFIEAHHAGDHGLSQKADDLTAIALCRWHHTLGPESIHVLGKTFWTFWGIDRDELIKQYNAQYEQQVVA